VNDKIRENKEVQTYELSLEEASKKPEIKQFFGEKYGNTVRVVDIDFSKELCGGTHTSACGTIGFFKIVKEGSIAQGVRRIEAVTGREALEVVYEQEKILNSLSDLLKVKPEQVVEKVKQLQEEGKLKDKKLQEQQEGTLRQLSEALLKEKQGSFLAKKVDLDAASIRTLADLLFQKEPQLVLVLAGQGSLLIRINDQAVARGVKANEWLKKIAPLIDASGGGRPHLVQGAFKKGEKLEEAFALLRDEMEL
jgi:alanyl-tRNA synthetase